LSLFLLAFPPPPFLAVTDIGRGIDTYSNSYNHIQRQRHPPVQKQTHTHKPTDADTATDTDIDTHS